MGISELRLNPTNHFLLLYPPFVRISPPFTTISITIYDGALLTRNAQQSNKSNRGRISILHFSRGRLSRATQLSKKG